MLNSKIYINAISVIAPGMESADKSLEILKGNLNWLPKPLSKMTPASLPANEARRTTTVIRLVLKALESIKCGANTAAIFASSEGDLDITDKICKTLATEAKMVSPTLFHNSVHNAPAGYFSIATGMTTPSTSLSAGDDTFSAGLIEAVTQVMVENNDVLLVAYDNVSPQDLDDFRHFDYPVAIALLLSATEQSNSIGHIDISVIEKKANITQCFNHSLEKLRLGNPIGLGLPLIEVLIKKLNTEIVLPYLSQNQVLIKVNNV
ncbi:3-oxoacyl-[ACP] synthase [uncultured Candidatus Thioglobus sp.]|nr:3-oxoacyl-[ACP] synthase [uncultured Candidatus Thioglobus sp.]